LSNNPRPNSLASVHYIAGEVDDEHGWLTPVEEPKAAAQTEPQLAG
jgi:hypothetical protein